MATFFTEAERIARELAATPPTTDELARITGRAKSNLSRTLRTMAGYGLVRLDRGERASAAFALNAALDVFGELGLRSLSIIAADALERLASAGASARSAS